MYTVGSLTARIPVVDFLVVSIKLFSLDLIAEAQRANVLIRNRRF